jgi:hypothetical protein
MRKVANVESQLIQKEIEAHIPWYWNRYESLQEPLIEQSMEVCSDGFTSIKGRKVE